MAQSSNRIRFTTKGKKGDTDTLDYVMPKFPLERSDALHWHTYTRHDNGSTRVYVNVHKEPDSLEDRIVAALRQDDPTFTVDQWRALPQVMKDRTLRDIDIKSSPAPAIFMPTEVASDLYLEYADDQTFRPKLVHKGDALDVQQFAAVAGIAGKIAEKAGEYNAQNVPLQLILDSFGVLQLKAVIVKDPKDQNAAKVAHFAATNGRADASTLTKTIHAAQRIARERATKASGPTPPANVTPNGEASTAPAAPAAATAK